jgi:hypothetical protein
LFKTYDSFLNECKYLEECKLYINRGIQVPKTIHGKKLTDYLVIDLKSNEFDSSSNLSTPLKQTFSTIITKEISTQTEITSLDKEQLHNLTLKRKYEIKDEMSSSINNQNIGVESLLDQQNENIFLEPTIIETPSKKKRLLIGKNIEKQPILSVSTLERQLTSIINDAAEHLKQEEEYQQQQQQHQQNQHIQNQQQQTQQFIIEPNTNELVLITNNSNLNEQNFNFDFRPSPAQPQLQLPIQPQITKHFNLKNALTSKQDDEINLIKVTRSQTALKQQNENMNPTNNVNNVVVKKKRVYRRITPTIRTIYENNNNTRPQTQKTISNDSMAIQISANTTSIIADQNDQSDFFDMPLNSSINTMNNNNNNKNSVTTDDELDMIFGTSTTNSNSINVKNNLNNSSLIDKLLNEELNSSKNNKSLKDDEFDLIFGPSPVIQNTNCNNNGNQNEFDVYRNTRSSNNMNKTPLTPVATPSSLNSTSQNKKYLVGGANFSANTTPSIDHSSSTTRSLRSRTSSLRKMI